MASQNEIAQNIIANLRFNEPSMSLAIGTPERMIIEAIAQAIAENQIDINVLNGGLDIEAKVGQDLDNVLGLFGFGRQTGTKASGFLTLGSNTPLAAPLRIPAGTQFLAKGANSGADVAFVSSRSVIMEAGSSKAIIPIEAINTGVSGNVPANTINDWNGSTIVNISSINNESPLTGGTDSETDAELKARFKTAGPFRNLAGTKDNYLALALSTKAKKANVVGPVSKYTEYIQVPSQPDSVGAGPRGGKNTEYTSALSTNTQAKYVYSHLPYYVSDDTGTELVIYTQDVDFVMNLSPQDKNRGDAYRAYAAKDFTNPEDNPEIIENQYRPNITFTNVYTGTNVSTATISPNDILFFEYSYLSKASRNDYLRGVSNCVDVYVDALDPVLSSMTIARPGNNVPVRRFNSDDPASLLFFTNFRRKDHMEQPPVPGNIYTPVLNQPMIDLPDKITTGGGTFLKNVHYWPIMDVTDIKNTIRARNGIEWAAEIRSKSANDPEIGPYTGAFITDSTVQSASLALGIDHVSEWAIIQFNDQKTLPDYGTIIINDEQIFYQKRSDGYNALTNEWESYDLTGYEWDQITSLNGIKYGASTLKTNLGISETGHIQLESNTGSQFPSSGTVLIDEELITYANISSTPSDTLRIAERGVNGTTISAHKEKASVGSFVIYQNEAFKCIDSHQWDEPLFETTATGSENDSIITVTAAPSNNKYEIGMLLLDSTGDALDDGTSITSVTEEDGNITLGISLPLVNNLDSLTNNVTVIKSTSDLTTPDIDTTNWSKVGEKIMLRQRGINSTTAKSHIADSVLVTPFDALDNTLSIENYIYNGNIVTLQAALEGAKQITTDVLAHQAKFRYFKPDVTIMYQQNVTPSEVNLAIVTALKNYFDSQYFGAVIQLSDVLQIIKSVGGVDNARWSKDLMEEVDKDVDDSGNPRNRLTEVNRTGDHMKASLQRISVGDGSVGGVKSTKYLFYLSDDVEGGTIHFKHNDQIHSVDFINHKKQSSITQNSGEPFVPNSAEIYELSVDDVEEKLSSFATVTANNPSLMPSKDNPYLIEYTDVTDIEELTIINQEEIIGGEWVYNNDFLLGDDELAAMPELSDYSDLSSVITIRARAQNTWNKI